MVALSCIGCIRRTAEPEAARGSEASSAPAAIASEPLVFPEPSGSGTVTVNAEERFQKLDGFGAAVAWFIDRIVKNPPEGIYKLLFPELGTDILRFRNRYQRTKK